MAAFVLVAPRAGAHFRPTDSMRSAVVAALRERSPGEVREHTLGGAWCCHSGPDGFVEVQGDTLVAIDGRPKLLAVPASKAGGAVAGFSTAGWRDDGEGLLVRLDGGFALAAYDRIRRRITLARDRFGARSLYWVERSGVLFAASECKILQAAGIPAELCREAIDEVLICRSVQGERTLLAPYRQVPPATCVTAVAQEPPVVRRYWRMEFVPERAGTEAMGHYRDETRRAMREAIADASDGLQAVGVLLSGGVDSSVIAGVARETVGRVICFAGRLPDDDNLELERALKVAGHLGLECRVVDIQAPDLKAHLRAHVRRFEAPPRHPNNFVLQQLFARARDEVELVLQGDAAEMTFGLADVRRVALFKRKHDVVRHVPQPLRLLLAQGLWRLAHGQATRLAKVLAWDHLMYSAMLDTVAYTPAVQRTVRHLTTGPTPFLPLGYFGEYDDFSDALQAYQMYTFSTVSLLRHDRLAQPLGLTSESPFLRAPVVDVAMRLPRALRYVGSSKPVLRALCDVYLPAEVSQWPKLGFPVPWKKWVRTAVAGGIERTDFLADVLPTGFLDAALATQDAEALWTVLALKAFASEFGFDANRPGELGRLETALA